MPACARFPMSERLIVLCEPEEANEQRKALLAGLIEQCREHGLSYLLIPPLYHIPESSKLWKQLAECLSDAVLLGWLHPRPAYWLLHRHGIVGDEGLILNLGSFDDVESAWLATVCLAQNRRPRASQEHTSWRGHNFAPADKSIGKGALLSRDGTRSSMVLVAFNCEHCLQFCLFGGVMNWRWTLRSGSQSRPLQSGLPGLRSDLSAKRDHVP